MALRRRLQDMATQPPPRSPFRTRSVESEQTPSGAALRRPRSQDALSATLSDRSEKAAFGAQAPSDKQQRRVCSQPF
jgi:hypothetical protein